MLSLIVVIPVGMMVLAFVVVRFNGWLTKNVGMAMLSGMMIVSAGIIGIAIAFNVHDTYWHAKHETDKAECLRAARRWAQSGEGQ